MGKKLETPIRLIRDILHELVESKIISETCSDENTEPTYHPACDIGMLTIKYVINGMEHNGTDNVPVSSPNELEKLSRCLKDFGVIIEKSPANVLLKNI